jgi:DNA-binding XRE family transcriptional regulator
MVTPMKIQRVRKELSQVELAEKVGLPQWKISLIERGLIPLPGEARRIAEALETNIHEIFPALAQGHQR